MQNDAGFTSVGHGDAQGYELFCFEVENTAFFDGFSQGTKGLGGFGDGFVQRPQLGARSVQLICPAHTSVSWNVCFLLKTMIPESGL